MNLIMRYLRKRHALESEKWASIKRGESQRRMCGSMADRSEEMEASLGEDEQELDEDIMRDIDLSLESST